MKKILLTLIIMLGWSVRARAQLIFHPAVASKVTMTTVGNVLYVQSNDGPVLPVVSGIATSNTFSWLAATNGMNIGDIRPNYNSNGQRLITIKLSNGPVPHIIHAIP